MTASRPWGRVTWPKCQFFLTFRNALRKSRHCRACPFFGVRMSIRAKLSLTKLLEERELRRFLATAVFAVIISSILPQPLLPRRPHRR